MSEPYCLAMVLCDSVHRDPTTNKFYVMGTFSALASPRYPTTIRFFVYFAITDGLGENKIRIRLVDSMERFSDHPEDVVATQTIINFPDPLVVVEGVLGIQTRLPHDGVYHCELYTEDTLLMSRRLVATKAQQANEQSEE